MKMKKSISAILMTTVILLSFLGAALLIHNAEAADPAAWYNSKNGVLTSDYYSLYPYVADSIDVGISKFGEMIADGGSVSVGLQYPGYEVVGTHDQRAETSRDPFANEGVEKKLWLNGWVMEIRYTHRTLRDRKILAMGMFADMSAYGGDWINGFNASKINGLAASPHGGRKCTAYATTDALQTLYDGPRRWIALSVTHIFDWSDDNGDGIVQHPDETWPVLDLRMTFIFEKDKKEVIILKDIKLLMSGKELASPVDVQFGDREEWDLGESPEWPSYAHFYHQQLTTCFGPEWHMADGILREYDNVTIGPIAQKYMYIPIYDSRDPYGPPIANGSVRVYLNGVFLEEGLDYNVNLDTGRLDFITFTVGEKDKLEVIYKLHKYDTTTNKPFDGVPHLYDVAQIISADYACVGWKAYWPTLSDYTVDGWTMSLQPLYNVSHPDLISGEPEIPFTIGEWDFLLGKTYPMMFRGVEVVGLTDCHDASDAEMGLTYVNILDREVMYQLNEVFNPWDLVTAVHKPAARWVEFTDYIEEDDTYTTDIENVPVIVRPDPEVTYVKLLDGVGKEYIPNPTDWDQYAVFSERIINLNTSELLVRGVDYDIHSNADGTATIDFYVNGTMKILYSTMGMYQTTIDNANNAGTFGTSDGDLDLWLQGTSAKAPIEFYIDTGAVNNWTSALTYDWKTATLKIRNYDVNLGNGEVDAVYLNGYLLGILQGDGDPALVSGVNATYPYWTISEFEFPGWILNGTGMQFVQIFIACNTTKNSLPWIINPKSAGTWPVQGDVRPYYWGVEVDWGRIVFNYDENTPMPRYEWVTVGRQAHSVDSMGSALVAAAFKDKEIEIGNAGMDMAYMEAGVTTPNTPYVMSQFSGTVPGNWANYKDTMGRTALVDDWCTTYPVASSDMIVMGGPLANLLALYFNDYTDGFYGINTAAEPYTPYSYWQGKLAGITCWNKTAYAANATTGFALISTYLDINGTVGFIIYGLYGRDTYYASKWFHDGGIHELQTLNPCVTSLIIKIDYKDDAKHPVFTIMEYLGTISEKYTQHDP
jgi:hypothetical protein